MTGKDRVNVAFQEYMKERRESIPTNQTVNHLIAMSLVEILNVLERMQGKLVSSDSAMRLNQKVKR